MAKVYLVGAGPGDPGLITVKGLELLKKADVVIYDRLGTRELLKFVRQDAELIDVGKRRGKHTIAQEKINEILVEKARTGKLVVRLKGGDPFVFGRGGEEVRALEEEGIPCEVVPGVTSAIAVPALAGIPVTDRAYSSSFSVVTGQESPTKVKPKVDYGALQAHTVVILMGVRNLPKIAGQMLKTRPPQTPVAIIERGTTSRQRVITTTLGEAVETARKEDVRPPAIIVVGEVVRLRKVQEGQDGP
ncbi:MAG: uroporphyrinogen-III C-methyltransferase [Euryarchaeota archaeon]|nr:uroporphyrinogen-III C-methyltransferase [Euryarchaeota archaeon]